MSQDRENSVTQPMPAARVLSVSVRLWSTPACWASRLSTFIYTVLHDGYPLTAWPWLSVALPMLIFIAGGALGGLVLDPSQIALLWLSGCVCAALACWSSALALSFTFGVLVAWGVVGHFNEWPSLINGYRLLLLAMLGPTTVTAFIGVLKIWRPTLSAWLSYGLLWLGNVVMAHLYVGLLLDYPEVAVVEILPPQDPVIDPYRPAFLWLTASASLAASGRVLLNWLAGRWGNQANLALCQTRLADNSREVWPLVKRIQPIISAVVLASVVLASGAGLIGAAVAVLLFTVFGLVRKPVTRGLMALAGKIRLNRPWLVALAIILICAAIEGICQLLGSTSQSRTLLLGAIGGVLAAWVLKRRTA